MAASPALTLPQQFLRFLFVGFIIFIFVFWLAASTLVPAQDLARDQLALKIIVKSFSFQSTNAWLRELDTGYIPFFLQQRALVVSYALAVQLAWALAFLFDTKILRREKTV